MGAVKKIRWLVKLGPDGLRGTEPGGIPGGRFSLVLAAALLAGQLAWGAGCATRPGSFPVPLGQEVTCAGLTYQVLGCQWAHRLQTERGQVVPTHGFLLVRLALTNSGESDLPAGWLPQVRLVDEHYQVFPLDPVTAALGEGLRGTPAAWKPTVRLSGVLVYDVPQALYWLEPEGCPRLALRCWWPERFGD